MIETYAFIGTIGAVFSYGIHAFFADREKARQHETKLAVEVGLRVEALADKLAPLDEHVRTNLENFKTAMVATLKDIHTRTVDLDEDRKRVTSKATATIMGRRLPQP